MEHTLGTEGTNQGGVLQGPEHGNMETKEKPSVSVNVCLYLSLSHVYTCLGC